MVKLPTSKKHLKKLAYKLAEQEVVENLLHSYLNWWTKQEIQNIVRNGNLVILPLPDQGIQIAHYFITRTNNAWKIASSRSNKTFTFTDKLGAIFYCLFEYKKLYVRSAELLNQSTLLSKLENDEKIYRHKYNMACSKRDGFGQDLWQARLSNTMPQLNLARDQLQKMIKQAKYIKIWD